MNKILILSIIFLSIKSTISAQSITELGRMGDSCYAVKEYKKAISYYLKADKKGLTKNQRKNALYNVACCYGLLKNKDKAYEYLVNVIKTHDYKNIIQVQNDPDLEILHGTEEWEKLIRWMQAHRSDFANPRKAEIITKDVRQFWKAYDEALKDTNNRKEIFQKRYFDIGTEGLDDYFYFKIRNMDLFVKNLSIKDKFFKSIRRNTFKTEEYKPQITRIFEKMKEIYPEARFPNVYFVIGRFNSGGTSTDAGLLVGLDMMTKSDDIPLDELSLWERNNYCRIDKLPHLVAHELVHYEQRITTDTTLLNNAILEGMADFIGEIISGKVANERQFIFAKGKEKQIWEEFKKEMYLDKSSNWIANSTQETPDRPADLGYWMGYQICKSYYDEATDKPKAIKDMLNMKDSKLFLEKSKLGEKMDKL